MPEPVPGVDNQEDSLTGEFANRLDTVEGTSLMFVSLGTPNSKEIHESLAEILTEEYGVESLGYYEKEHFSRTLSDDDVQTIFGEDIDGVIEGFALCGSCNSSSSVDAIAFESQGIPTVQIISDDFINLNKKIAGSYGYDELPLVSVPQSTKYLPEDEVTDLCKEITDDLLAMLTCEDCVRRDCATHGIDQAAPADD